MPRQWTNASTWEHCLDIGPMPRHWTRVPGLLGLQNSRIQGIFFKNQGKIKELFSNSRKIQGKNNKNFADFRAKHIQKQYFFLWPPNSLIAIPTPPFLLWISYNVIYFNINNHLFPTLNNNTHMYTLKF